MTRRPHLLGWATLILIISCQSPKNEPLRTSASTAETHQVLRKEPAAPATSCLAQAYEWLSSYPEKPSSTLEEAFPPPLGFERQETPMNSFAAWLRCLPILPASAPVMRYDGTEKGRQDVHARVIAIDIGKKDLQQCADAIMRLRAEYLYATQQFPKIAFHFTNNDLAEYVPWRQGKRILLINNHLQWKSTTQPDTSWKAFRQYLGMVYAYAGTFSLSKELQPVPNLADLQAGDVFIEGGFPGHAMLVADMAVRQPDGEKAFLLVQSYMPAQSPI